MNVFLIGFMGSGKSTVGKQLSTLLQRPFYDLDEEIEKRSRKTISEIFKLKGEKSFRQLEAKVLRSIRPKKHFVMACGGGTPCFHNNVDWMNKHGMLVYLKTSEELLFQRLKSEMSHRPLLAQKSEEELRTFIKKKVKERSVFYESASVIYRQESNEEEVAKELVKHFSQLVGH